MTMVRAKNFIETVKGFDKNTPRKQIEEQLRISFQAHHTSVFYRKKPKITDPDITGTTALIEAVKIGNFDAVDVISTYITDAEYANHVTHKDCTRKSAMDYYGQLTEKDRRIETRLSLKDADLSRVTPVANSVETRAISPSVSTKKVLTATLEQKEPSSSESLNRLLHQSINCVDQEGFLELLTFIINYERKKLEQKQDKMSLIPNICKGILLTAAKENNFKVIEFLVSEDACKKLHIKSPTVIWNTLLHLCIGNKNLPDEMQPQEKYAFIKYFLSLAIQLKSGVFARCSADIETQIKVIIAQDLSTGELQKQFNQAKMIASHGRAISDPGLAAANGHFKQHHRTADKSADLSSASDRSQSPSHDSRTASP